MSNNLGKSLLLFIVLSLSLGIVVVGVLSFRSYFTRASGSNQPTNVRVSNISANSANVLWETSSDTQGIVRFATDPSAFSTGNSSALLFAAETASTTKHQVKLSSLKADTTYYYEVAIKDSVYDQNGLVSADKHLPFSFSSSKSDSSSATSDLPTLDAEVFKQKFGSNDPLYDLNKDGIVNATDYLMFLSRTSTPTE